MAVVFFGWITANSQVGELTKNFRLVVLLLIFRIFILAGFKRDSVTGEGIFINCCIAITGIREQGGN